MSWGLTVHGFRAKKLLEIKQELELELSKTIDPNLSFRPDSVLGQITAVVSHQTAQVWEALQGLYSSLDANTASGRALDALCAITNTYRRAALPSKASVLMRLAPGASVPAGSMASDPKNSNAQFKTTKEIKNNTPAEALLETEMIADELGPTYAKAASISHIVTPKAGWLGVTNLKDAILGRDDESNDELRLRRLKELRALGRSTHGALHDHLSKLTGVQAVHLEESVHSFTAYVMGADEQEICQTLWDNKPLGVLTSGDIKHQVKASNGQVFIISFSRPILINLALHIVLKVKTKLDESELELLKNKIIDHTRKHIKLGDDPYPSRIYPILFGEPKILDAVSISLTRVTSSDPVPTDFKPYELANFDAHQIFIEQRVAP